MIVTPYETGGETLGGVVPLPGFCLVSPSALGGSTSGEHEEEKGGAYDGGRHAEYCEAGAGLSGPLRLEQSAGRDRLPHACPDEAYLAALLHQCGMEAASITQVCADVQQGKMAVLLVVVSAEQLQPL